MQILINQQSIDGVALISLTWLRSFQCVTNVESLRSVGPARVDLHNVMNMDNNYSDIWVHFIVKCVANRAWFTGFDVHCVRLIRENKRPNLRLFLKQILWLMMLLRETWFFKSSNLINFDLTIRRSQNAVKI